MSLKDVHSLEVNRDRWTLKPGEKWTHKYPELGTGLVDFHRAVTPEFYAIEKEAVFRRTWLYMGRTENIERKGAYFTKEIEVCDTSVIVVRGQDEKIRAFHNTCPHRGNRLVWDRHPARETAGRCARAFFCKYHGLGFGHDGKIAHITDEQAYFGDQVQSLKLVEVACDVWNGFIFVNLDPDGPRETLREFIGEYYWTGFDGFPFDKFTERYVTVGECASNWKTLNDAFAEAYHAATLHRWTFPFQADPSFADKITLRQDFFGIHGRHHQSMVRRAPDGLWANRFEEMSRASPMGPKVDSVVPIDELPPAANPIRLGNWGNSTNCIFPNLHIQFYHSGTSVWWLTYRFWPLAHDRMRFEIEHYLPEAQTFSELLAHHGFLSLFRDTALQDVNLLEATQRGLKAGVIKEFPLQDEEIQVRHLHKTVFDAVDAYQAEHG
ncbi:aromatic ring-hydroxylating oxygenase subunit alpha [Sinimarinibacterium flocculans]|uniref:aromatic ring-hydroxylating oxygenase subunit alpha n=1 Tax=Sinimarinibacterium flocculans TaxID=985250 RepID=UPI0024913B4A|nr:SRPBCC family protein [Sinimarinibacterium flocculans]